MTEKTVKIQDIIQDLENGLMRDDIRKKYNFTIKETSILFKHPKLANKRAKKVVTLNIIDEDDVLITENEHELPTDNPFDITEASEVEAKPELNWL